MAKHTTRGVLRHVATDGSISDLEPFVESLCAAAKNYADADGAFDAQEARRLLVDAAYYLIWNTREYIGKRHRAKRDKMDNVTRLPTEKNLPHPLPSRSDDCYAGPILILDPETNLYSIFYQGCQIGDAIDIVGEREKIRLAAVARIAADPALAAELAALPSSATQEPK